MGDRSVKALLFKPEVFVRFYTTDGIVTAGSRSYTTKEGKSIDGDILSVIVNNDLGTDAGTFQITLSSMHRWDKVIASNDLIEISMRRRGEDVYREGKVFVGLVDDIRKNVEVQESSIHRTTTIVGRNFFKVFMNFEIGAIAGYQPDTYFSTSGWFAIGGNQVLTFGGKSASTNMDSFLQNKLLDKMDYGYSDGRKLTDVLKFSLRSREGENAIHDTNFSTFSGSALDFMNEVADKPFNEMFIDTDEYGKNTLFLRPTPFNPEEWNSLPIITVTDENVMSNDVGRSDTETYTFYVVNSAESQFSSEINELIPPLYYEKYLTKFGVKTLRRYSRYVQPNDQEGIKRYERDLFNWNVRNSDFWNGTITVIGDSAYKVGARLLYKSDEDGRDIEYYIEAVQHTFVNYQSWTTKLEVTRGLENSGADRFSLPWDDYDEYNFKMNAWAEIDENWQNASSSSSTGGTSVSNVPGSNTAEKVVNLAKSYLSKSTSYVFGGGRNMNAMNTGVFDCSSFVWHMFNACGVNGIGTISGATTDTLAQKGLAVSKNDIRIGDIVYWHTYKHNGHVGIYIGNRQAVACNTGKGVSIVDMDSSYWKSKESDTIRRLC